MFALTCPSCGKVDKLTSAPLPGVSCRCECGQVWCPNPVIQSSAPIREAEQTLYLEHPVMFRDRPLAFCLCVLLIAAYGIGLLFLLVWWLRVRGTTLTVTNRRSILREGILSRSTTEVFHEDIRNLQLRQSLFQRLFDVGDLGISSSGQAGVEIQVGGIPGPYRLEELLYQLRESRGGSLGRVASIGEVVGADGFLTFVALSRSGMWVGLIAPRFFANQRLGWQHSVRSG